jgi:hypothetical protein
MCADGPPLVTSPTEREQMVRKSNYSQLKRVSFVEVGASRAEVSDARNRVTPCLRWPHGNASRSAH